MQPSPPLERAEPCSHWRAGHRIGPAVRGRHRGQYGTVVDNLGPTRHRVLLDTLIVRWDDGTEEETGESEFI